MNEQECKWGCGGIPRSFRTELHVVENSYHERMEFARKF